MFSMQTGDIKNRGHLLIIAAEDNSEMGEGGDATLEDVAEREQDYLRGRLRDELQREPTDEELNEWLREHTEGY
jgi:hypothetical protein